MIHVNVNLIIFDFDNIIKQIHHIKTRIWYFITEPLNWGVILAHLITFLFDFLFRVSSQRIAKQIQWGYRWDGVQHLSRHISAVWSWRRFLGEDCREKPKRTSPQLLDDNYGQWCLCPCSKERFVNKKFRRPLQNAEGRAGNANGKKQHRQVYLHTKNFQYSKY